MRKEFITAGLIGIVLSVSALTLEEGFLSPPRGCFPQVWWWFSSAGKASKEAITRDLEAMKDVGVTGCHLYGGWSEGGPARMEKTRWALREAGRLGIDTVLCIGAAGCGSPRTDPWNAQKDLVFTCTDVRGGGPVRIVLPKKGVKETPKQADGSPSFYKDIAVLAWPAGKEAVPAASVLNVSDRLDRETGVFSWDAPTGDWRIARFGYVPKVFGWEGCYIDHMSRKAFDAHWNIRMAPLLAALTPEERKSLKGVMCDSWECGTVSWTESFREDFERYRGYDLLSWLPVRTGATIGSPGQSARFLRDFALTISDLIGENHYAYQREVAHRYGLVSIAEAAGPHQRQADVLTLQGRCDVAMGEFWMPSSHRPSDSQRFMLRDAANAAHVYGIPEVLAESFTTINTYWEESLSDLKPCADRAFCDGLTRACYHGMMLSPSLTERPGLIRNVAQHYNPQNTWWRQSRALNLYLGRCSWMLSRGRFAADALLYRGDGINVFAGLKTPADALGEGYDYDFCPTEILLRAKVTDGEIVLPSGMRYRVLMLSDRSPRASRMQPGRLPSLKERPSEHHTVSEAAMLQFLKLVEAGATLAGDRPMGPTGLLDSSARYHAAADRLWGPRGTAPQTVRKVGKGRVITGLAAARELLRREIPADFAAEGRCPTNAVDWIHRILPNGEIWFVANRLAEPISFTARFRVTGLIPERWDAVTGTFHPCLGMKTEGRTTGIPLTLDAYASAFIVFRRQGRSLPAPQPFRECVAVKGPWSVSFDPIWGGPAETVFARLVDWTASADDGIRHYSGTAVYRTRVRLTGVSARTVLDLGTVHDVAEVTINGRALGIVWTAPRRLDISAAVKDGENDIEIRVTNSWPNRLIKDASLPPEKRLTRTNLNPWKPDHPLFPAGLIGPVKILR